jgi:hypothetical protein
MIREKAKEFGARVRREARSYSVRRRNASIIQAEANATLVKEERSAYATASNATV